MPNWCSNTGVITGTPEVIETLWNIIHSDDEGTGDLTMLRPCPDELANAFSGWMSEDNDEYDKWKQTQADNISKHGYASWYEWCVDKWGTKWSPRFDFSLHPNGTEISFQGDSAWSPPCELLRYVTEAYPVYAMITYTEESNAFVGATICEAGKSYESCSEPTNNDWESDDYYDSLDSDVARHEQIARERYHNGEVAEQEQLLLGRDIIPAISAVAKTLTKDTTFPDLVSSVATEIALMGIIKSETDSLGRD